MIENTHPIIEFLFVFGMKVLIVKVVEQFHELLEDFEVVRNMLDVNNVMNKLFSKVEKKIMKLVADYDDLVIEGITSARVVVFLCHLSQQF